MARPACSLLAGLLASAHGFAPNPPACADSCGQAFNNIVGAAGMIVGAVQACVPDISVDPAGAHTLQLDCSDQILGIVNNIASAGSNIAGATFNCGNVDSGCAQQILGTLDDFTSFGQDIISAVGDCPIGNPGSGLFCAKDVINACDDLVNSAKDIDSAVERCAPPEDFIAPPPPAGPPAANETDIVITTVAPAGSGEATAPGAGGGAKADQGAAAEDAPNLPERRRLALQELEESWASARSRLLAHLPRSPVLV